MAKLRELIQVFQHGPTGGAILGRGWPFEPELEGGYRVRLVSPANRGDETLDIDVFASEDASDPVPEGSVDLRLQAGTRVAIGEIVYELQNDASWRNVQSAVDFAVVWDPTALHGNRQESIPAKLESGGYVFSGLSGGHRFGIDPNGADAYNEAVRAATETAQSYQKFLSRLDFNTIDDADVWTNDAYFLGDARSDGFATEPEDVRYWPIGGDIDAFGEPLELMPNFSSLSFRGLSASYAFPGVAGRDSFGAVDAYVGISRNSPWLGSNNFDHGTSGFMQFVTNRKDVTNKRTLTPLGTIPIAQQVLGNIDRNEYFATAVPNHIRRVFAVPDWIDPVTLRVAKAIEVRALEESVTLSLSVGDPAPMVKWTRDEVSAVQTGNTDYVRSIDARVGSNHGNPGVTVSASDATPGPVRDNMSGQPIAEFSHVVPNHDGSKKVRYRTMANETWFYHFVSQSTWTEIYNSLQRAVADYFSLTGDIGPALRTPRLHALRFTSPPIQQVTPDPTSLNTRYGLTSSPTTFPLAALLPILRDRNGRIYLPKDWAPGSDQFLDIFGFGFTGAGSNASASDLARLGIVINPITGQLEFQRDEDGQILLPNVQIGGQLFLTEQQVPGNDQFIDSGGTVSFRNDDYVLGLVSADLLIPSPTARTLRIAPPVPTPAATRSFVDLVERIIPPADDSRNLWARLVDFTARAERTAGLDDDGDVEQTETVNRSTWEVRRDPLLAAGQYLRDPEGRLWQIVGVADNADNRRNLLLTCEREFDRRRTASTYPRFLVPVRRV